MNWTIRRLGLRTAVGIAAVSVFALIATGAPGAAGKYTDPSGDGRGGPDITNVQVVSFASGQIVFTISVDGIQPGSDTASFLLINADANRATGDAATLGSEYAFAVDELDNTYGFARWNGSDWDWNAPDSTVQVGGGPGMILISVNASELGGTQSFNFWVRSIVGEIDAGNYDDAPDGGAYNYTVAAGGPDIRQVVVKATPNSPRAGRRFSVSPTSLVLPEGVAGGATAQPESFSCVARLGNRAIRGSGAGGCSYTIPKRAKGKRLSITLTVTYQGAEKRVALVYRVR
jgi:hypothetical protein